MLNVRSIIIFNGGSAGDFLRTVCLEQLQGFDRYQIDANGTIRTSLGDNYLKELCKAEQRTTQRQPLINDCCASVENAHSYHSWFHELTNNLFYIHHDDADTLAIVRTFIQKRAESNIDLWIKQTMPRHIPETIIAKINQENFDNVLSIFWKKNIQEWQSNSLLTPIPIRDLFNIVKLTKWVETLCGQPLSNPTQLANTHQMWLNKNSILLTSLT